MAYLIFSTSFANTRFQMREDCVRSGSSAPGRLAAPIIMNTAARASQAPIRRKGGLGIASMSCVTRPFLQHEEQGVT